MQQFDKTKRIKRDDNKHIHKKYVMIFNFIVAKNVYKLQGKKLLNSILFLIALLKL